MWWCLGNLHVCLFLVRLDASRRTISFEIVHQLFVLTLNMPNLVGPSFAFLRTKGALELGFFATLPLHMARERVLPNVGPSTSFARITSSAVRPPLPRWPWVLLKLRFQTGPAKERRDADILVAVFAFPPRFQTCEKKLELERMEREKRSMQLNPFMLPT